MFRNKPPIRRAADGRYAVELSDEERDVLVGVTAQIAELFDQPESPGLHRSFPPAYQGIENVEHAEEYREAHTAALAEAHRAALATLTTSAAATSLDGAELDAWMRALTQLRLVLGTQIGLSGNEDELPDTVEGHLYEYLTYVQSLVVEALAGD